MITYKKIDSHNKDWNLKAGHPLQSWEWGTFRERAGNKIIRLGSSENGSLTQVVEIILSKIPGTTLKIGTVIKGSEPDEAMLSALKEIAKEENCIFIKLEPNLVVNNGDPSIQEDVSSLLKKFGAKRGKRLFTPTTFWIDLSASEDNLLKNFTSKTRYNIRLAQKHGVKVTEDNSEKAFAKYLELTRETVERQGFYAHTQKYHRLMWQTLHKDMVERKEQPIARLLTAVYRGEIITTWIVFVWHDFLYYPYGASTEKYKNVMASNLMMWEAMRYGKKLGLKKFDLWGREEGKGFTKFKEGYNPQVVEFIGTWDLPCHPFYKPYLFAEKLRWYFLRGKNQLGIAKPKF